MVITEPQAATRWMLTMSALLCASGVFLAARFTREPAWSLAAFGLIAICVVAIRKLPMGLCAALMFVGNFKTTPAQGISFSDPTMMVLMLCAAAVGLELLYSVSGTTEWPISRLLRGQAALITLFFAFLCVLLVALVYTQAKQYGLSKVTRFAVFETLAFFAPLVLLTTFERLRALLGWMVVLSLALALRDFYSLMHPSAEILKGNTDITQIGDGMLFGTALLIMIFAPPVRSRILKVTISGTLVIALLIATARTPIVALLLALLISAVMPRRRETALRRSHLLAGIGAAVLISAAVLMWMKTLPAATAKVLWKEQELLAFASGSPRISGTMLERVELNKSALRAFTEHPITGLGAGGWSVYYSKQDIPRFPHDFLLEVAAEEGIVGVGLLAAIIGVLLARAMKLRNTRAFAFLFPILLFMIFYNAMTGDVENRQLWFWFGAAAASTRFLRDPELRAGRT